MDVSVAESRNKKKINVAISSLIAAVVIVLLKLFASIASGSLAVLSELFHSTTDLFACLITIISIRYSSKPPDKEHQYGHEKIESISALIQVLILILMCGYVFYEAIDRIINPPEIELNIYIFSVIILCILIDFSRAKALKKVAKETKSQALEADALHFSSDILSSFIVLTSMILTKAGVNVIIDSITAIIVGIIIIITTFRLIRKAVNSLLDRTPDNIYEEIYGIIENTNGVEGIKNLRVRRTGMKTYVDSTIYVNRTLNFAKVHKIMDEVENNIQSYIEESDIIIHSEPCETKSETVNEKVKLIVDEYDLKSHDIFSYMTDNKINIDLHIEIDDKLNIEKAHNMITDIENHIMRNIENAGSVNIHIDEPSRTLTHTKDITKDSREIVDLICTVIEENEYFCEHSDIKILSTDGKIRISLNCRFQADLPFEDVHDKVTMLENKIYTILKKSYTSLSKVIIHAEPK